MSQNEPKKELYRRFVEEIINGGKYELIPEIFDPGYLDHSAPPGAPGGLGGVEAVFKMFRGGFPDVHFDINTMLSEGDKVATRVSGPARTTGPSWGRRRPARRPPGARTASSAWPTARSSNTGASRTSSRC